MTFLLKFTSMVLLMAFGAINGKHVAIKQKAASSFTVKNLSKKWKLTKYKYLIFTEGPAENERNDYIHLKTDMTFQSVSEGKMEEGNWRLDDENKRSFFTFFR